MEFNLPNLEAESMASINLCKKPPSSVSLVSIFVSQYVSHVCEDICSIRVFPKEQIFVLLDEISGAWTGGSPQPHSLQVVK